MTVKVLVADFEYKKYHPYEVKTKGKHPIHIIEGGDYITEDMRVFDECSDCGVWRLNQKEYDYFKSNLKEIELDIK